MLFDGFTKDNFCKEIIKIYSILGQENISNFTEPKQCSFGSVRDHIPTEILEEYGLKKSASGMFVISDICGTDFWSAMNDVIFFGIELGGSEGSNCWGDEGEDYNIDGVKVVIDVLNCALKRWIENGGVKDLTKEEFSYAVQNFYSDDGDYYGNFTQYNIFMIDLKKVFFDIKKIRLELGIEKSKIGFRGAPKI